MTKPFIIFGAGGHGEVVLDAARVAGMPVAWVVDDEPPGAEFMGARVLCGNDPQWIALRRFSFIVAVGDNRNRARVFQQLLDKGGTPVNVLHPAAIMSPHAELGRGIFCAAGSVINPAAKVRDNCIINTCASVDHDCVIGAHVHICPGVRLGGNVTVGAGTMIGLGAVVLPGIVLGENCVVGAGSVVNGDLPAGVVAYGKPVRVKRTSSVHSLCDHH
jgi:sugar O-acyltransferase (sialic acid O-acetyltransferase NeuD family)